MSRIDVEEADSRGMSAAAKSISDATPSHRASVRPSPRGKKKYEHLPFSRPSRTPHGDEAADVQECGE